MTQPLPGQIRDLAGRIEAELLAADAYYDRTKAAWRAILRLGQKDQSAGLVEFGSESNLSNADLEQLAESYISGYLAESVLQIYVALFEDFVFSLLGIWLTAYPEGIPEKAKKSVDLATILDAPDKDAILGGVIERELEGLRFRRPAAWFAYLNDRVKLGGPSPEQVERLTEIKATRDLLVHNRGVVNEVYLAKAGPQARYPMGERVDVEEPYLQASGALIGSVVADLSAAAISRAI